MTTEHAGPVALSEVEQVVTDLNALLARAMEHNQHSVGMVLHLAAESLADNLEQAQAWDTDDV